MGEMRRLVSPARVFARPTADQIWLGPAQQAALSQLSRHQQARLLVGPSSSGKSTLLGHLATHLGNDAVVLQCRGPKETPTAVLASLLLSADLEPWELSEIEQRNLLSVFVQQRRSQGRRVVLVIDDAHTFKAAAWEEIERLVAFKIDRLPAIEVVLVGPRSFAQRFDSARAGLAPNDFLIHELGSPSQAELVEYVDWRLERFAMNGLVTPVASQMIARLSGGRYTAVDVLCQMSLLLLRQMNLERVDARVARQAVAALAARHANKVDPPDAFAEKHPVAVLPQGYLLINRPGKPPTRATLGQRTLIGRSEHNDICLESPYLSRHHAVIVGTPDGYYVVDLNSANGLTLNGQRVERAALCDQDLLTLGPFRLKMQLPEWLSNGNPLPEAESLTDTAVMPAQPDTATSNIWLVKQSARETHESGARPRLTTLPELHAPPSVVPPLIQRP